MTDVVLRVTDAVGNTYDDPSAALVTYLVHQLEADDSFLILSRLDAPNEEYFAQTMHATDGTWYVEYRQGSAAQHWTATAEDAAGVAQVLRGWAAGTAEWRNLLEWCPLDPDRADTPEPRQLPNALTVPASSPADDDRRRASLARMGERYDYVCQRVLSVYGLRLPRSMAVFAAFLDSLTPQERLDLQENVGLTAAGITQYFGDGGLLLTGRDGLDERLESRFRSDPPEFVTVLDGESDGLHFGLWYDDPAELPTFVAYNYARDSAETWTDGAATPLAAVQQVLSQALAEDEQQASALRKLRDALEAFLPADTQARRLDGDSPWARVMRPEILGGLGPALPPGAGNPRGSGADAHRRSEAYRERSPWLLGEFERAERELQAAEPAYALVLGRELHWLDLDDYRDIGLRLLVGSYRALQRDALADIATTHSASRDLRSVRVLQAPAS